MLLFALILLPSFGLWGAPPEGLENFGLIGRGKASGQFVLEGAYHDPVWRQQYSQVQTYAGGPWGGNYLSAGFRSTIHPSWGDRSASFVRYDLRIGGTASLALKYVYEVWRYISTSKDAFILDFNTFFVTGQKATGIYVAVGPYYRWMRQRWNTDWSRPLNFQTEDQEWHIQSVIGFQKSIGEGGSYWTFDINTRDHFSYQHMDNSGFDFTYNAVLGPGFLMRLRFGIRTAALFMGTGHPSEYQSALGFVWF